MAKALALGARDREFDSHRLDHSYSVVEVKLKGETLERQLDANHNRSGSFRLYGRS